MSDNTVNQLYLFCLFEDVFIPSNSIEMALFWPNSWFTNSFFYLSWYQILQQNIYILSSWSWVTKSSIFSCKRRNESVFKLEFSGEPFSMTRPYTLLYILLENLVLVPWDSKFYFTCNFHINWMYDGMLIKIIYDMSTFHFALEIAANEVVYNLK